MATKFGTPVVRVLTVKGVEVNVTLDEGGVKLTPKGRQLGVFMSYEDLVREVFGQASTADVPDKKVQKVFEELGLL